MLLPFYKFAPVLKETVWGGHRISHIKKFDTELDHMGESWEVSGLDGAETHCSNRGEDMGLGVNALVKKYGDALLGTGMSQVHGTTFPLLIKFIDAASDLSIQVHPNDAMARMRGYDRGKTEMWYVVNAEPGSHLLAGFAHTLTPDEYKESLAEGDLHEHIACYEASAGDCFHIEAGCIHAICAGTLIIEVQQTSNVTYRVFDYNRPDLYGQLRKLHTEEAMECINLDNNAACKLHYASSPTGKTDLNTCTYFHSRLIEATEEMHFAYTSPDSFHALICFEGSATISTPCSAETATIAQGETVLVPAATTRYTITPDACGVKMIEASLLPVHDEG